MNKNLIKDFETEVIEKLNDVKTSKKSNKKLRDLNSLDDVEKALENAKVMCEEAAILCKQIAAEYEARENITDEILCKRDLQVVYINKEMLLQIQYHVHKIYRDVELDDNDDTQHDYYSGDDATIAKIVEYSNAIFTMYRIVDNEYRKLFDILPARYYQKWVK
jgi:hypothetical protein